MESILIDTQKVLEDGGQLYARISVAGYEKIIPAGLIEMDGPVGAGNDISARFEIDDYTDALASTLKTVRTMTIYLLNKGVLYAIPSKVVKCAADSTLRFTVSMPKRCRGAMLRQHERYSVMGTYRLYQRGVSDVGCKLFPVPMNISLGGFGIQMETPEVLRGDTVNFELTVYTQDDSESIKTRPSVDLNGTAKICNLFELETEGRSYLGFSFNEVPASISAALSFWLKSHDAMLNRI